MFNIFGTLKGSENFIRYSAFFKIILRTKHTVDKSYVPVLAESDLEEHFIKGSGPGGTKVNKSVNCVSLLHKPTGLHVKVHECRELHLNRKIARQKLTKILDNFINGENSVENQLKKIANDKTKKRLHKQRKLLEMKSKWKASLADV